MILRVQRESSCRGVEHGSWMFGDVSERWGEVYLIVICSATDYSDKALYPYSVRRPLA